jgi:hypothetical protein
MNMQCKNYDASTGAKASVVSMEPDLLLGTSIPMLLLAFVGFFMLLSHYNFTSK